MLWSGFGYLYSMCSNEAWQKARAEGTVTSESHPEGGGLVHLDVFIIRERPGNWEKELTIRSSKSSQLVVILAHLQGMLS